MGTKFIKYLMSVITPPKHFFSDPIGDGFYSFPNVDKLCEENVEQVLRNEGFGYRAKYIQKSAKQILEKGGDTWFELLQSMTYQDAHQQLLTLCGIGAKVRQKFFV